MTKQTFELINPFRLSNRKIVRIAEQLSREYAWLNPDYPAIYFAINFDHVYDTLIYPLYGILLEEGEDLGEKDGERTLGYYDPASNAIALDRILDVQDDPFRWKKAFTAWHELGHAFLHGEWLRSHRTTNGNQRLVTAEADLASDTSKRLERQANLFASTAAAPSWFVDFVLKSSFRLTRPISYIGPSMYWLEVWDCPKKRFFASFGELCSYIAYLVCHRFGDLSVQSLGYRIADSRWVVNASQRQEFQPPRLQRSVPMPFGGSLVGS